MNKPILEFEHIFVNQRSKKTLLALHGTGGDENDLLPLAKALDETANILSPRGKVSEAGALRFFRRLAEGVFDRQDLKIRSTELGEFLAESSKIYNFDLSGVVAVGFSNGANIALHLLASNPKLLNKAILLRPMSGALPDENEISDLSGTKILLLSGIADTMVAPGDSRNLVLALQAKGAEVEFHELPAGHRLTGQDLALAKTWLANH